MAATFSSAPFSSMALLHHPLSSPSGRPPAEDIESSWILEFVLRQPIPDSLAHEIFLSLPFSSSELHPHLCKTLLLRRLSSDLLRRSISERTLHSLELIEELDRLRGVQSSSRLKAAYCTAAIECTASFYQRDSGDFKDAVEGIWKSRIFNLMRSEAAAGLVSESLLEWGMRMGHYLLSGDGIEELLKKDVEDAVRLVKDYVEEALEEMGPSFLEIAAAEYMENMVSFEVTLDKSGKGATEVNACSGKLDEHSMELENARDGENCGGLACVSLGVLEEGEVRDRSGVLADTSLKALKDDRAREESVCLVDSLAKLDNGPQCVVGLNQHSVEVEIGDNRSENVIEYDKTNQSECLIRKVSSDEVNKVKEALKKSCFDLNMVVEDPLPEAQAVAAIVSAIISRDHELLNERAKQSSVVNAVSPVPTILDSMSGTLEDVRCFANRNSSDLKHLEGNHDGKECNKEAGPSKGIGIVSRGTLFERNSTAHTFEWSDVSQESGFEKSPVPTYNLQSPNSKTRRNFLPRLDNEKFARRRVIKRWTSLEEDTLREAVAKCGKGNWKLIMNSYSKIFAERTEIDLKDKWRNMSRHIS